MASLHCRPNNSSPVLRSPGSRRREPGRRIRGENDLLRYRANSFIEAAGVGFTGAAVAVGSGKERARQADQRRGKPGSQAREERAWKSEQVRKKQGGWSSEGASQLGEGSGGDFSETSLSEAALQVWAHWCFCSCPHFFSTV